MQKSRTRLTNMSDNYLQDNYFDGYEAEIEFNPNPSFQQAYRQPVEEVDFVVEDVQNPQSIQSIQNRNPTGRRNYFSCTDQNGRCASSVCNQFDNTKRFGASWQCQGNGQGCRLVRSGTPNSYDTQRECCQNCCKNCGGPRSYDCEGGMCVLKQGNSGKYSTIEDCKSKCSRPDNQVYCRRQFQQAASNHIQQFNRCIQMPNNQNVQGYSQCSKNLVDNITQDNYNLYQCTYVPRYY